MSKAPPQCACGKRKGMVSQGWHHCRGCDANICDTCPFTKQNLTNVSKSLLGPRYGKDLSPNGLGLMCANCSTRLQEHLNGSRKAPPPPPPGGPPPTSPIPIDSSSLNVSSSPLGSSPLLSSSPLSSSPSSFPSPLNISSPPLTSPSSPAFSPSAKKLDTVPDLPAPAPPPKRPTEKSSFSVLSPSELLNRARGNPPPPPNNVITSPAQSLATKIATPVVVPAPAPVPIPDTPPLPTYFSVDTTNCEPVVSHKWKGLGQMTGAFPFEAPNGARFSLKRKDYILVDGAQEAEWVLAATVVQAIDDDTIEKQARARAQAKDAATVATIVAKSANPGALVWFWVPSNMFEMVTPEKLTALETTRKKVGFELVDTEATYVSTLQLLTYLYSAPLRERAAIDSQEDFLSKDECHLLFRNVESIRDLHVQFLGKAAEARTGDAMGQLFLSFIPYFKIYYQYVNQHGDALQLLTSLLADSRHTQFQNFAAEVQQHPSCNGLNLQSFLITPVQRVPRYRLLLVELLANTLPFHPDYFQINAAIRSVSSTAALINEELRESENRKILRELSELLLDGSSLFAPGRKFIRRGKVKVPKEGGWSGRMLFMFSDMLLFCQPRAWKFKVLLSLELRDMDGAYLASQKKEERPGGGDDNFSVLTRTNGLLTFYTKDVMESNSWLADLTKYVEAAQLERYAAMVNQANALNTRKAVAVGGEVVTTAQTAPPVILDDHEGVQAPSSPDAPEAPSADAPPSGGPGSPASSPGSVTTTTNAANGQESSKDFGFSPGHGLIASALYSAFAAASSKPKAEPRPTEGKGSPEPPPPRPLPEGKVEAKEPSITPAVPNAAPVTSAPAETKENEPKEPATQSRLPTGEETDAPGLAPLLTRPYPGGLLPPVPEAKRILNSLLAEPLWQKDADAPMCPQCNKNFNLARRRHHCRVCGVIYCGGCMTSKAILPVVYEAAVGTTVVFPEVRVDQLVRVCSMCAQKITVIRDLLPKTEVVEVPTFRAPNCQIVNCEQPCFMKYNLCLEHFVKKGPDKKEEPLPATSSHPPPVPASVLALPVDYTAFLTLFGVTPPPAVTEAKPGPEEKVTTVVKPVITKESWLWLPHDEYGYVPARLQGDEDDPFGKSKNGPREWVTFEGEVIRTEAPAFPEPIAASNKGDTPMEDLINMGVEEACAPAVLHSLRTRYQKDLVYTNVGDILVVINPFKPLPIYSASVLHRYSGGDIEAEPPHVFKTTALALTALRRTLKDQCIIICGESGSGKTESSKIILQYLSSVADPSEGKQIEQCVLRSTPILESFGNAKTLQNDNSSRFGKWISLTFDANSGQICGGSIATYLLEKSRVVTVAQGERNYHIFYQLCSAATIKGSNDESMFADFTTELEYCRNELELLEAEKCFYLHQSGLVSLPHVNEPRAFKETLKALDQVGIQVADRCETLRILAGILHLGNVTSGDNDPSLAKVARLLSVDQQLLKRALWTKTVSSAKRKEMQELPLSDRYAMEARSALAKALFGEVFDWLCDRITESIARAVAPPAPESQRAMMGVLDIFGFECFAVNSLEQLFINYANEKLQHHFNQWVSRREEALYTEDEVLAVKLSVVDNQQCLTLLEGTQRLSYEGQVKFAQGKKLKKKDRMTLMGVLQAMEEDPLSDNTTELVAKLNGLYYHEPGGMVTPPLTWNPSFGKPAHPNKFVVEHYAGNVEYTADSFLLKNRDSLDSGVIELLVSSKCRLLHNLFAIVQKAAQTPAKKKQKDAELAFVGGRPDGSDVEVYDRVMVKSTAGSIFPASVLWKGAISGQSLLGVRFDAPIANGNGTLNGKAYFTCQEGYGSFVKPESVQREVARQISEAMVGEKRANQGTTLSQRFRNELVSLVQTIEACNPHFVRCIRPNYEKQPHNFQAEAVLAQMKTGGLLEALKIRRSGFPFRRTLKQFFLRFYSCLPPSSSVMDTTWDLDEDEQAKTAVLALIKELTFHCAFDPKQARVGKSMVFLTSSQRLVLDQQRRINAAAATVTRASTTHLRRHSLMKNAQSVSVDVLGLAKAGESKKVLRERPKDNSGAVEAAMYKSDRLLNDLFADDEDTFETTEREADRLVKEEKEAKEQRERLKTEFGFGAVKADEAVEARGKKKASIAPDMIRKMKSNAPQLPQKDEASLRAEYETYITLKNQCDLSEFPKLRPHLPVTLISNPTSVSGSAMASKKSASGGGGLFGARKVHGVAVPPPPLTRPQAAPLTASEKDGTRDADLKHQKVMLARPLTFIDSPLIKRNVKQGAIQTVQKEETTAAMDAATAVYCFESILGYMGEQYAAYPVNCASAVLSTGLSTPHLRDEIYVQLMKQTIGNPSTDSQVAGWKLIFLCIRTFLPTVAVRPFLLSHIARHAHPSMPEIDLKPYTRFFTVQTIASYALVEYIRQIDLEQAGFDKPPAVRLAFIQCVTTCQDQEEPSVD